MAVAFQREVEVVGLASPVAVVLTGLYFMYAGIQAGKELLLGTIAFVAGFLSGRASK